MIFAASDKVLLEILNILSPYKYIFPFLLYLLTTLVPSSLTSVTVFEPSDFQSTVVLELEIVFPFLSLVFVVYDVSLPSLLYLYFFVVSSPFVFVVTD